MTNHAAAPARPTRRIEPEALGPLEDRPLVETAKRASPDDLFPGASRFLNAKAQNKRRDLWRAVEPVAGRLLQSDEKVLHVIEAVQVPPPFDAMALGYLARVYHQVLLVVTDRRLIEVLLDVRGKVPATRVRSYPWKDTSKLDIAFFRKLKLVPAKGKKQMWGVPAGGDATLMKLLLPRLRERLLAEGAGVAQKLPYWHCPSCIAAVTHDAARCARCGTTFRSARLAAVLSLAFPGAGLFYAGHPVLAAFDFIGEALLFALFTLALVMSRDTGESGRLAAAALIFLVLTKVESLHLSHLLVRRTRPDTPERQAHFRRFALAGAIVSVLFLGGAAIATGAARPVVDRDLDPPADGGWSVTRNTKEFAFFADDPDVRAEWLHPAGAKVTVFAYPLTRLESPEEFRSGFRRGAQAENGHLIAEDEAIPAPFQGFRAVQGSVDAEGHPLTAINYFVFDPEGRDIHQFFIAVRAEEAALAESIVREAVSSARWIAAAPPAH